MVSRTSLQTRIKILSATVSMLLVNEFALAATIGHTNVYSKQHEPLVATIDVSDIKPDNLSVTLADKSIYQKLNMDYNSDVNAHFEAYSKNSGKLVLKSSIPLSKPFADVILVLNDDGKLQLVPKTILPPLENKRPLVKYNARSSKSNGLLISSLPKLQSATLLPTSLTTSLQPKPLWASSSALPLNEKLLNNIHQEPSTLFGLSNKKHSASSLSNTKLQARILNVKKSAPPPLKGFSSKASLTPDLVASSQSFESENNTEVAKTATSTNQLLKKQTQQKQTQPNIVLNANNQATSNQNLNITSTPKKLKILKTTPAPLFTEDKSTKAILSASTAIVDSEIASLEAKSALPRVHSPEGDVVIKVNNTQYQTVKESMADVSDLSKHSDQLINQHLNESTNLQTSSIDQLLNASVSTSSAEPTNNDVVTISAPRSIKAMQNSKASNDYNLPNVLEVSVTRQIKSI